jgi:hypothetical protein
VVASIVIVQGFEIKLPLFIPREPHSPKFQAQTEAQKTDKIYFIFLSLIACKLEQVYISLLNI